MLSSVREVAIYCTLTVTAVLFIISLSDFRSGRAGYGTDATGINGPGNRVAFATFLAADSEQHRTSDALSEVEDENDGYYMSARVLAYQLMHSRTAGTTHGIPFLVLCTEEVKPSKREQLRKDGATILMVDKLEVGWVKPNAWRWKDAMMKLRLFELTKYDKILFIDADTLVTGPLDEVFIDSATETVVTKNNKAEMKDDEGPMPRDYMFATRPDTFGFSHSVPPNPDITYFNVGFFVFRPSRALFNYYVGILQNEGRFNPGLPEQNLLNYAHRKEGNMPWKSLEYKWNVNWATSRDWRAGIRSFHAKYWTADGSLDTYLQNTWLQQKAEMQGFYRGRDHRVW